MPLSDLTILPPIETRACFLIVAMILDSIVGDPEYLWKRLRHPIVHIGNLIGWCDQSLNNPAAPPERRKWMGIATITGLVIVFAVGTITISTALQLNPLLAWLEVIAVAVFLAARSLHEHVARVARALRDEGLPAARRAVSMIVGRDPDYLDESGVSRAAIESAAENFADGVVAPAFWYLVAGLPGIVVYKLINTADSMIGHKTDRHRDFGWAAARIDDLANLIPARLSGIFIALGAAARKLGLRNSLTTMWRDAGKHASPNAGWPETAMAGALGIALAGPRKYPEYTSTDRWLNDEGRKVTNADDIFSTLKILSTANFVQAAAVICVAVIALLV